MPLAVELGTLAPAATWVLTHEATPATAVATRQKAAAASAISTTPGGSDGKEPWGGA